MSARFDIIGIAAAALLLATSSTARARAGAAAELMRARSFCMFCTVGTGQIVSGDEAFLAVLRSRHATDQLQAVFDGGNIEGKMYALVGLRELDRARFDASFRRIRGRRFSVVMVATVSPATALRQRGDVVLQRIRQGDYGLFVEWARTGRLSR